MPATKTKQSSKATVSGLQGPWVPFGQAKVYDKIWSGKKVPPDAWRVLFWLTNRMTGAVKYEDDPHIYGVVAGSNTISYREIASDLQCCWRSVQRSIQWLADKEMISRGRSGLGEEYRYCVIDSIRQFELVTIPGDSAPETDAQEVQEPDISFLDEPDELQDYAETLDEDQVSPEPTLPSEPPTVAPQPQPVPPPIIKVNCPMPHCTRQEPESGIDKHMATRDHLCANCEVRYHTKFELTACQSKHLDEYKAERKAKEEAAWVAMEPWQRRNKWEKDKATGLHAGWTSFGRWRKGEEFNE